MIDFYIQTEGVNTNPPLLFLHGFMGSTKEWLEVIEKFSEKYYCLLVDLPGHGKTVTTDDTDYTMPECAHQLIKTLRDRFTFESYNLIGYSMGGRLAYYLLLENPELFHSALIASATPGLKTSEDQTTRKQKDSLLANRLAMEPYEQFLDDWYAQPLFVSLAVNEALLERTKKHKSENSPEALAKSLRYMGTGAMPSLWERLGEIKTKLHLIAGAKDAKFKMINDDVVQGNPMITSEIVDNCGHAIHLEQPDSFCTIVKKFFK